METTNLVLNKQLNSKETASLVQKASQFSSDVKLTVNEVTVDAKSIMGVMILALRPGSKVKVEAVGNDAKLAVEALEKELI